MFKYIFKKKFEKHLMEGEEILWCGKARDTLLFFSPRYMPNFMFAFGIFWTCLTGYWSIDAIKLSMFYVTAPLMAVGIIFIILGLVDKSRACFAVTNQRILKLKKGILSEVYLKEVDKVGLSKSVICADIICAVDKGEETTVMNSMFVIGNLFYITAKKVRKIIADECEFQPEEENEDRGYN